MSEINDIDIWTEFQVYRETNQKLMYLNKGSNCTNATLNKFPISIFNRLAKIISRAKKNSQMRIYERYQGHSKALTKDGLDSKIFTTLKNIWKKSYALKLNNDTKQEKISVEQGCITYLCIGFSKIWREKICNLIKKSLWLHQHYLVT